MSGPPGIEEACDEIVALRAALSIVKRERDKAHRERDGATRALEDLAVECSFWKRAAEQSLRMWEHAQDDLDGAEQRRFLAWRVGTFGGAFVFDTEGE